MSSSVQENRGKLHYRKNLQDVDKVQVRMMMYLCGGLKRHGIVGFDWRNAVQFDIKEEENKTIERRTQTVTETSNTSDHSLNQP